MEASVSLGQKECRLCGCCKPLQEFRIRSDSRTLRSECAACQNKDNSGRNKRARAAKGVADDCVEGRRSLSGSSSGNCSWREADSSGLIEHDAQLHKLLFCGFRASAQSFVHSFSGTQGSAAARGPMQAACSLLEHLLGPAAGNAPLQSKTLARHAELRGFLRDDAAAKVLLLETRAMQVQHVMQQMHAGQDALQAARGAFMVAFPKQDLAKETKLHRLLEHSCGIETYPGLLSLGNRSVWRPQDSKESMVPLFDMLQLGIAAEMAVDRLACSWHVDMTTIQDRFCLTAALLDSLPGTLHTLYEPELNLLTDRHHKQLLRDGSPTVRTRNSLQAALPHLQMCDEDVARLRLDPEAALQCDAGRCSSQAATAWSLADEAIGKCLPKAYADFNALELMEGISLAAVIVSMIFTYTPAHVEDMLQGAVNDLVVGAWKAWYIVDPGKAGVFKELLSVKYGPDSLQKLFEKRLRPVLSAQEMRDAGVRIIFQPPGFMVVTLPGEVFHWTISLGASIAESSNFFTTAGGTSLASMCGAWQRHAQEARSTHNRIDVAAQLADALTSFGVLGGGT